MVFGGLIGHTGKVEPVTSHRLRVHLPPAMMATAKLGDSIAVNGVCLTIAEIEGEGEAQQNAAALFDLSDETLAKTTLGKPPTVAHLEPALRLSDVVGGHVMSGHVHGTAELLSLNRKTGDMLINLGQFLEKGYAITGQLPTMKDSISIDGVSLTVAEVIPNKKTIRIALIEHTMKLTLFKDYKPGQAVNIEYHVQESSRGGGKEQHDDAYWMGQAVLEAEKGRYTAAPNPWVGAVLIDQWNSKVAAGHHVRAGERHAERMIESPMTDCTLFVTLEPCSHHGRTPPCVDYLLERKPSRVVVGVLDPDPRVSGRGVAALRAAGIQVDVGVGAALVAHSLRAYLWHRTHDNTPYVVGKLAVSMDNCFAYGADTDTNRTWITGPHAREHSHGVRAGSQRVVVGKHTKEMDKPELTVRYNIPVDRQPEAVVSTRDLTWLQPDTPKVIQVLVEGGPELHNDLLQKAKLQEFILYRSTRLLGLAGVRWMPSFLDTEGWTLVETKTFPDGDTMQRFLHHSVTQFLSAQIKEEPNTEKNTDGTVAMRKRVSAAVDAAPIFDSVETAVKTLKEGGLIVVMDNEDRENEGDLMMLADRNTMTLRNMKQMLAHTTGIVCATITATRAELLDLPLMVPNKDNKDNHGTKFTVTVDAADKTKVSTGVSALDRMETLAVLGAPSSTPTDLVRPGHIFPLIAAPGGLLERQGHTEAGVELARLAGMEQPCMVISELYDQSTGKMMTRNQCSQLGFPIITVSALQKYAASPKWASVPLQGHAGDWEVAVFSGIKVIRLCPSGTVAAAAPLLLRIHSECFTGDVLGSALCDCGNQLQKALGLIAANGRGMIVFPPEHEGRGIGLENKLKAYKLQRDQGLSTYDANKALGYPEDARHFGSVAAALTASGVSLSDHIHLLTENPQKVECLRNAGFTTVTVVSLGVESLPHNSRYLADKKEKFAGSPIMKSTSSPTATSGTVAAASAPPKTIHFDAKGYTLSKMAPPPLKLTPAQRTALSKITVVFVQAEWHRHLSDPLVESITASLTDPAKYGFRPDFVERHFAPGSFELPRVIQHLSQRQANCSTIYLAVGILVKGDTDHYDLVAKECTSGLARLQLSNNSGSDKSGPGGGLWIVNAVLATHTVQQAADRCLPEGPSFVGENMAQATARLALTASWL